MIDTFMFLAEETDRSRILRNNGQYTFSVHQKISKTEVKRWIETVFKVKVIGLNSKRPSKKQKQRGKRIGYPVRYKQIIVSLKQIPITKEISAALIQPKTLPIIEKSIARPLLLPISDRIMLKEDLAKSRAIKALPAPQVLPEP
jgi:large subunit ribosomal protein L23